MITRSVATVVSLLLFLSAVYIFTARTQAQTASGPMEIGPGCDIPSAYGKLVSIIPAHPGGPGVGTALVVFEAEDGVVRWVAGTPTGTILNTQTVKGQIMPAFLSKYECMLSSEWKRH